MFGNAMAAVEAFIAGGGVNFNHAIAQLHSQIEKVLIMATTTPVSIQNNDVAQI